MAAPRDELVTSHDEVEYWSVSRIGGCDGELAIMTILLKDQDHAELFPVAWYSKNVWCLRNTDGQARREFVLDIEQHEIVLLLAAGKLVHWLVRASQVPERAGQTVVDLKFKAKMFFGVPITSVRDETWLIEPEKGYKKEIELPSEKNLKAIEAARTPRKARPLSA